jgi:hypothetical protein
LGTESEIIILLEQKNHEPKEPSRGERHQSDLLAKPMNISRQEVGS